MARLTRHQLKQDRLQTTFEEYEHFAKQHWREIVLVTGILVVVVGLIVGLRMYTSRQEMAINAKLGAAFETFNAHVGVTPQGSLAPVDLSFGSTQEKYKKALGQFNEVTQVKGFARLFPQPKAARIARYYAGLCEADLGDQAAAIKTLQDVSRDSDSDIAALARFALAGELAKGGKLAEAVKQYQDLADHSTSTVPRATALLAMADAYRDTQPVQARKIYDRLQKEYATDDVLAGVLKQDLASLSQ